jgi:soluble lytic murein transglycosylase-like protein
MMARSASAQNIKHAKRRAFLAVLAALSFRPAHGASSSAHPSVADRIARRYRVERSAVERVIALAERYFPIDPGLLLAIAGIESSWRPWAVGGKGEVGLCQVRPDIHGASATELADAAVNIRVAAKVLRDCVKRSRGDVAAAVARYNGRGAAAADYAARVLQERDKLLGSDASAT